jgi:MFS family permease
MHDRSVLGRSMDVGGKCSGTVSGMMNMAGNIGGALAPIVFGVLAQFGSWQAPFIVAAGLLILGAAVWARSGSIPTRFGAGVEIRVSAATCAESTPRPRRSRNYPMCENPDSPRLSRVAGKALLRMAELFERAAGDARRLEPNPEIDAAKAVVDAALAALDRELADPATRLH